MEVFMKHRIHVLFTAMMWLVMCSMIATATSTAATVTSTATGGNWSAGGTWVGGVLPGTSDDVVIANAATVTIDANVTVASITVGQGVSGTLTFDNAAKRIVVVTGNITVAAGAAFIAQTPITTTGDLGALTASITNVASTAGVAAGMNIGTLTGISGWVTVASFTATTITLTSPSTNTVALPGAVLNIGFDDSLSIGGNLANNGTFDMSRGNTAGVCHVTFNKAGDQTISGTGATTRFRNIWLNKTAVANKVISSINVTAAGTPLTILAGTWEQNANHFTTTSGSVAIGSLTATSCAMNIIGTGGATIFSNINVYGALLVNTSDSLIVGSGGSKIDMTYILGATGTFTKGTVLVYGKWAMSGLTAVTVNGANIIVDPKGFASLTPTPGTDYAFRVTTGTGGVNPWNFSSGTLTILNPNSTPGSTAELAVAGVAPNMSGTATIILGQGAATVVSAAGFKISTGSTTLLNHLTLNTGADSVSLLNAVKVNGNLTIKSCAGRMGNFYFSTPNYVFNGTTAQLTGNILPDTVKNVTINNGAGVTTSKALTITDTLFLVSGTLKGTYTARVTVTGGTAVQENTTAAPREFGLNQNYPNPFNPSTSVSYRVAAAGYVSVKIFNALGQEAATLVNEVKQPGAYTATWNAAGFGSGMYFYTMKSGSFTETKKMILMK
jgi:hypothetical protein